jgi:predicted small lipoprotein YifL
MVGGCGSSTRQRLVVRAITVLLLAAVCGAFAGCGSNSPQLIFPPPGVNAGGVGLPSVRLGEKYSVGMESTICLSKPGVVTLTEVTPVHGSGLRVVGSAMRPNQNWKPTPSRVPGSFLGEQRQALGWLGFTGKTVDVACAKNTPKGYELAVRVAKTTVGTAHASGWVVTYESSGHTGTLRVPFSLTLHAPTSRRA